jgi:hypothetical protein
MSVIVRVFLALERFRGVDQATAAHEKYANAGGVPRVLFAWCHANNCRGKQKSVSGANAPNIPINTQIFPKEFEQ